MNIGLYQNLFSNAVENVQKERHRRRPHVYRPRINFANAEKVQKEKRRRRRQYICRPRINNVANAEEENVQVERRRRRKRVYRPRINFDREEIDSGQRFRVTRAHIQMLEDRIGPIIVPETNRNFAFTAKQRITLALSYLAAGDYYRTVADSHGCSKSTQSRVLHRFVSAVNTHIYPEVVDWPKDQDHMRGIVDEFQKRGMPNVFGCVDGSLIRIVAPSVDEPQFVDSHKQHSINVMLVCGPKLKFYYVDSRWPGSVEDALVFRNSSLKRRLDTGWRPIPHGVLLGDSAYADTSDYIVTRQTHRYVIGACGWDSIPCEMGMKFAHDEFDGTLNSAEMVVEAKGGPKGIKVHFGTFHSLIYGVANRNELKPIRQQIFDKPVPRSSYKLKARGILFNHEDFPDFTTSRLSRLHDFPNRTFVHKDMSGLRVSARLTEGHHLVVPLPNYESFKQSFMFSSITLWNGISSDIATAVFPRFHNALNSLFL